MREAWETTPFPSGIQYSSYYYYYYNAVVLTSTTIPISDICNTPTTNHDTSLQIRYKTDDCYTVVQFLKSYQNHSGARKHNSSNRETTDYRNRSFGLFVIIYLNHTSCQWYINKSSIWAPKKQIKNEKSKQHLKDRDVCDVTGQMPKSGRGVTAL